MPTKISYQTWTGGDGSNDPKKILGYCKENPMEVLNKVYEKYYIYHYKDLYRPVDENFPNNVAGLVIEEVNNPPAGCVITGSINDLDLSCAYNKDIERNIETYQNAIKTAKDWHLKFSYNEDLINKYKKQIKEVEEVCLK